MLRRFLFLLALVPALQLAAQEPASSHRKAAPGLPSLLASRRGTDSIDLSVSLHPSARPPRIPRSARLLQEHRSSSSLLLRLTVAEAAAWITSEDLAFVNLLNPPREELTSGTNDISLNRINYLHFYYPFLRGDSLAVTVKERAFDSTDIDLQGRVLATGLESDLRTSHASLMATILAGAGNSSRFAQGAAPAAAVGSTNFSLLLPETDAFFRNKGISVQNHSYGTIVENFYGTEAVAYDQSAVTHPQLLHVFSAGNSGNQTPASGAYAGIAGYANLTGNFKQSKNSLSVGATDSTGDTPLLSSKGPAYDGRIKPELVAFGENGSSGAAALVSGSALLVQQAARRVNGGQLPPAALVKAALINGADDAGAPLPDYRTGYGSLNTFQSVRSVLQQQFFLATVAAGETRSFSLTLPAGLSRLRLTLAWTDPAAAPNAPLALVNDLDLRLVRVSSGESWLPWVLNPAARLDSLRQTAQRRRDTLNNVEQVSLETPAAGNYRIEVRGARVLGSQAFALVYQTDTADRFLWTYPTAIHPLTAGNTHILHWETSRSGSAQLEYSYDGLSWRIGGSVPDLSRRQLRWTVPDTLATAVLRMRAGTDVFLSDTFAISPEMELKLGFDCRDSFLLYWKRLPQVSYELSGLKSRYLEPLVRTPDTALLLQLAQQPWVYFSLSPIVGNRMGVRSNTLNRAQGSGCYINSFYVAGQTASEATLAGELGTLFRVREVSLQKLTPSGFVTISTLRNPQSASPRFTDPDLNPGANTYRMMVVLDNGLVLYSDRDVLYHFVEGNPIIVYPNPVVSGGNVQVFASESGRYSVRLLDVQGRTVWSKSLTSTLTLFPAVRLPAGVYFLRFEDRDGRPFTQKLVVY